LSPVAERNDKVPKGQARGARSEQESFIQQTGGDLAQEPSPVSQPPEPVEEPTLEVSPQTLGDFEEPDFDEEEDGEGVDPETFQALMGADTSADVRDMRALARWRPILDFIASQPGASEGMRNLAAGLRSLEAE